MAFPPVTCYRKINVRALDHSSLIPDKLISFAIATRRDPILVPYM